MPGLQASGFDKGSPERLDADLSKPPATPPGVRHWIALSTLLLAVIAVVVPPLINVNRYHRLISDSISAAIGRPVHMADIKLVMLPRPGFELTDFVVEEDPAFGAEPILRSATVRASIRLISLWRGRLEIARIHFEEPSLNLVRNRAGQWNVANILIQAARIPNAPTAQRHAGGTLRFPYIEASNARVNFKLGDEKKPFSFLNSDLSLWLDQPDEWQLRFAAQPVRTDLDLNLADTGLVRVRGSIHRAPSLTSMPVDLTVDWSGASLGQLSRLLTGQDPGWRGTIDLHGAIVGTPDNVLLKSQLRGTGIHRFEFEPDDALKFDAACELHYRYSHQSVDKLTCLTPVGEGKFLLTGLVQNIGSGPHVALDLQIDKLPVAALFRGMQLMRGNFPQGIRATGDVNGHFAFDSAQPVAFSGQASVDKLILGADGLKQPMTFNHVIAAADAQSADVAAAQHGQKTNSRPLRAVAKNPPSAAEPRGSTIKISSLPLAASGDPPLQLNCTFSAKGFALRLAGTAPISRILALNSTFKLLPMPSGSLAPQGVADLDLTVHGPWLIPLAQQTEGSLPVSTEYTPGQKNPTPAPDGMDGTLHLRNTQLTTTFLAAPINIVAASAIFSGNTVNWRPISFDYGPLHAEGSLSSRVPCPAGSDCARRFDLHIDSLDIATLQSTLLGARREQLVEELISRITERPHPWPHIEGTLKIDTLTLNDRAVSPLTFHKVTAQIAADGNAMSIQTLTAKSLGGDLQGAGMVDASGDLPAYTLQFDLVNADAVQAAALFQERWGAGAFNLKANLHLSGYTIAQLRSSATGTFHAAWTGHGSPPATLSTPGEITNFNHFESWISDGMIAAAELSLNRSFLFPYAGRGNNSMNRRDPSAAANDGKIAENQAIPVTGTITFARQLNLQVGSGPGALALEGTLQQPVCLRRESLR